MTPSLRSPGLRIAFAGALALLLASCAPGLRAPAPTDLSTVQTRHERLRAMREARLVATRLDATAWIEGESFGDWPAVQLDLALTGPDGVRARLASLFGTALDLQVRGDSMSAYVPPRRIGLELGALEDSLGVRLPGAWACRALAANWRPENGRWSLASGDSLWRCAWIEGNDSLSMSVDSRGLPRAIDLRAGSGRRLLVRYPAWNWNEGTPWPARIEAEEGGGVFLVELRMDRVRFLDRADPRWMSLAIPVGAERLDWAGLRRIFERLGDMR